MNQSFGLDYLPQPESVPLPPPRTALLVDDDQLQLEVLEHRLQRLGFRVTKLNSGQEVLQTAKCLQPHLILLDIELPDADGIELCQGLSDDNQTCEIPVVLLSGTERLDVVRAARSAGSRFFLRKPYDPNTLALVVDHAARSQTDDWS
ncbi:MAG: PleD family two-component system response regulator [Planctomycetota bacterium]|jgi:CheY-like chemotaxis protein